MVGNDRISIKLENRLPCNSNHPSSSWNHKLPDNVCLQHPAQLYFGHWTQKCMGLSVDVHILAGCDCIQCLPLLHHTVCESRIEINAFKPLRQIEKCSLTLQLGFVRRLYLQIHVSFYHCCSVLYGLFKFYPHWPWICCSFLSFLYFWIKSYLGTKNEKEKGAL